MDVHTAWREGPIQYDPESPFKYSNFVYHITLPLPITSDHARKYGSRQLGYDPIPDSIKDFIMRRTNPDTEGMNPENRVELMPDESANESFVLSTVLAASFAVGRRLKLASKMRLEMRNCVGFRHLSRSQPRME